MIKSAILVSALCGLFLISCASNAHEDEPQVLPDTAGHRVYMELTDLLAAGGDQIDYNTLMRFYRTAAQTRDEIPHIDRLLASLIQKRNDNPRVDQMVLIFAAKIIGGSKYPVKGAAGLFESILTQDDRINEWVIAFVAEAIEDYPVEMPEGNRLMDLLESKLDQMASAHGTPKEYFGFHFLPPPSGDVVRSYLAGIKDMGLRQSERHYYYLLIAGGYTEARISKALTILQSEKSSATGASPTAMMKYLFLRQENKRDVFK
jgi:hypothetical protein